MHQTAPPQPSRAIDSKEMSERIRRTRCCILNFDGPHLSARSFMTNETAALDNLDLAILAILEDWQPPEVSCETLKVSYGVAAAHERLQRLVSLGLVVQEGTALGNKDIEFETRFAWGAVAGYYHFGIKNPVYMTPAQMSQWLMSRVATTPRIPLFTANDEYPQVTPLRINTDAGVLGLMRRRRSWRGFSDQPLPLQALADCLFAGFGITGFVGATTPEEGRLPIGMTPSGGGRNPYEGYVYARNVEDLTPGVYHYSAVEHSLGLMNANTTPSVGDVLAEQPWFDKAAALVLLVAHLDRTIWKYPHPTGYRVVLLEAGHIAQNILLAATEHGLAAAPTCAVSDATTDQLLGLNSIMTSVVYTVSLGRRSDERTQADIVEESPNPLLKT